jgi:hypothetical protein
MNWEKIVSYNCDQRNKEISRVERSLRLKMAERSETSLRALSFATPRSAIVHKQTNWEIGPQGLKWKKILVNKKEQVEELLVKK